MKRNLFVLLVLIAVSMPFTACGLFKGSPTAPSDNPPPDQTGLEPLPSVPHQFVDESGRPVKAWAVLNGVDPLRRTEVAKQVCPANVAGKWCFSYSSRIWIEELGLGPGVNHGLSFQVKFSYDGILPLEDFYLGGGSIGTTINKTEWLLGGNGMFYPIPFAIVPKFLIFDGEYMYSEPHRPIKLIPVRAVFELDYR